MMFPHSQVPRTRHEHIFWGTSFHPPFRRQLPPPPFTLCITVHYTVPPCFNYPLSNSQCLIQATYTCLPVLNISQGSLEKQTSKILAYKEIYFVRNWLMQLWRLTSPIKEAKRTIRKAEHRRIDDFELSSWEKALECPLDSKEIKPLHPKGNPSWIFIGRTDAEAEAPILRPPDAKNWLLRKDPDAGKDWRQ